MKDRTLKMFLFFSELFKLPIVTSEEKSLGKLADLKVGLGEPFPKVTHLVARLRKRSGLFDLPWNEVQSFSGHRVFLKAGAEERFQKLEVGAEEMLLKEDLLDKQVVDTFGAKIERVNDIHLLIVGEELRLVHVDFGIRGILRRLGWIKAIDFLTNWLFAYQFPEKMISWKYVQPLVTDPGKKDLKLNVTMRRLHELHPSDLADILEELDQYSRSKIFHSLDLQTAAETLQEVDPKLQLSLIETTPEEKASDIIEEMEPDEATDFMADLPEEKKEKFLKKLEKPYREKIEELLKFREGTAGSIMTKDFLAFDSRKTIGEAREEFKKTTFPLETVAYLYVIDEEGHLVGVLTLRHLLICDQKTPLAEIMNRHLIKVETEDKVEKVAEIFNKYKFLAVPVVDEENILRGIITLQDIVESQYE